MYVIRDIFHLKFGHYKDAKALLDEAVKSNLMPSQAGNRVLSDFTGDAYRLVFEQSYNSLAEYEKGLASEMGTEEWRLWYMRFREHINSSHREILKLVM